MMCPSLDNTIGPITTAGAAQQHDMACYISRGKLPADAESSAKHLTSVTSEIVDGSAQDASYSAGRPSDHTAGGQHTPEDTTSRTCEVSIACQATNGCAGSTAGDMQSPDPQQQADHSMAAAETAAAVDTAAHTLQQQTAAVTAPTATQVSAFATDAAADAAGDLSAAAAAAGEPSKYVFFARVPPTVPYNSIHALFSQFGTVANLNLFRPWASAKTSKGCGIVEYEDASQAVAAMDALHQKYHWTGGETTMVVEWMDPARHRKDKQGEGSASKVTNTLRTAKSNRLKSGKGYGCLPPLNIAMALPGIANRMMPQIRTTPLQQLAHTMGLAYDSPAAQQAALMMSLGADGLTRQALYPGANNLGQLGAAGGLSGFGNQLSFDGAVGQFDAAGLEGLGYNMQGAGLPANWNTNTGGYQSMTGTPTAVNAAASGNQSWPLLQQNLAAQLNNLGGMSGPPGLEDQTIPIGPSVASMLLQRQQRPKGWAALIPGAAGSQADSPLSSGFNSGANTASLQQILGNMTGSDSDLGGLSAGLNGLGDAASDAAAMGAAANLHYLANLQSRLEAMGTGSPGTGPNSLYYGADTSSGSNAFTPTAAQAGVSSAATSWLLPNGSSSSNAQLPPVMTNRTPLNSESLLSHSNSPMAAGTPTYFQQTLAPGASNLNPGGAAPGMFNTSRLSSAATAPGVLTDQQLMGLARCASDGPALANQVLNRANSSILQQMFGAPASAGMSNLIASDPGHAWGNM